MYHNSNLTANAQKLRRNMTKEERKLWYEYLRNYPYQFRRQVPFGSYILDFYCAAAKLAVELDGSQHYDLPGQQYDARRTAFLKGMVFLCCAFQTLMYYRIYVVYANALI